MIEWIRGEMVGPARPLTEVAVATFNNRDFVDVIPLRRGPLSWSPVTSEAPQEVLYYDRESPHRKYGMGLLHPPAAPVATPHPDEAAQQALQATDTIGAEPGTDDQADNVTGDQGQSDEQEESETTNLAGSEEEFDVTSPDVRHPSTIGISFCVRLDDKGSISVRLPQSRRFFWQPEGTADFQMNGRYEACTRRWTDENGNPKSAPIWRRVPAVSPDVAVSFDHSELVPGRVVRKDVVLPTGSPIALRVEVFPRTVRNQSNVWLLTVVLRNVSDPAQVQNPREATLYQTFFEVTVSAGALEKYPESRRPPNQLDLDEQSLALLYREAATWGIGHGCAAGWDADPNQSPNSLYADVLPAVELPSMTPDIELNGAQVQLSMRALANLPDDETGETWQSLENLAAGYAAWIQQKRSEADGLGENLAAVATRHLESCARCLDRINAGISLLRSNPQARRAFRLANLAMLLQQIATKQLTRRPLGWNAGIQLVSPQGEYRSPWRLYQQSSEDSARVGNWRAFQVAFLLMSLNGVRDPRSADREIVDLVWFPTGGGKTEAYLAVMAFYMFHERLLMNSRNSGLRRDGTNVLMRYTLRMLTTQQFQRAASLICAMEFLRRNPNETAVGEIPGQRFSLGLWIGGDGSPNNCQDARTELGKFRRGDIEGNPLVLTECPWCRSEIGRYDGHRPNAIPSNRWNLARTRGIANDANNCPLLHCPDGMCSFGQADSSTWLPVEVIDDRIYENPPSLVIATVDKLAMIAYRPWLSNPDRPGAAALFGRQFFNSNLRQVSYPPSLIIQDELHLISGPLGTMYALYEGIIERLCSHEQNGTLIKPKIIASTATIRGASDQVLSLYARTNTQLFPSPGLLMGDSFFGRYATDETGRLRHGRLYLGLHASDYGSVLTTQVRAFSSALFRPFRFDPDRRDPWWTLLAFFNSIRELGGAKTLFDSDIRSRLKFLFNREGFGPNDRRNLRIVEELTSRLSQADIVGMMDRLAKPYSTADNAGMLDACLASNIIEVGVDIDRLSLMGVVGQPKTTATYIQVTGRVGRRWWERPGLILMVYNPSKSRDRSHFEQFHSYHRRLYERVEPTTATPFALSALQRGLAGALLAWARQHASAPVQNQSAYEHFLEAGYQLLRERCEAVQSVEDRARSLAELDRLFAELEWKWDQNPQDWEKYPPNVNGQYLMLWPGQFYSGLQRRRGAFVPSSMRQVDRSAELNITQGYSPVMPPVSQTPSPAPQPPNP